MNKIFTFLFMYILLFVSGKAQTYTIIDNCTTIFLYSYEFYEVRKDPESLKKQDMLLEVGKKCSKFYSTSNHYIDSLGVLYANEPMDVAIAKATPLMAGQTSLAFASFYVFKDYPKAGSTTFTARDMGATNNYKLVEQLDFGWKIDNSAKQKVMGYSCTKATCKFAGRDYEAWFTTEIPISDGPYKFRGLPGLIVKISDSDKEHIFELREVKNVKEKPMYFMEEEYIKTDAKGYVNALEASKAAFIATLNDFVKSDEERRIRAVTKVQRRNNFIEKY